MSEITNEGGWVTISDDSGSGTTELTATVNDYNYGRNPRECVVVGTTAHGATASATIHQDGYPEEYVTFDSPTYNIANDGTSVTVTGRSNSSRLTFSFPALVSEETDYLNLPQTYTASKDGGSQSVTVNPSAALSPDYGATGEYAFSITLTTKDTSPSNARSRRLIVTANGGMSETATITQAGVASTILFDGYATGKVYDATSAKTLTINIGVTPSGEGWEIEFDE